MSPTCPITNYIYIDHNDHKIIIRLRTNPDHINDLMTESMPSKSGSKSNISQLMDAEGILDDNSRQSRQKILHDRTRDTLASIMRGNSVGSTVVEPHIKEAQEVDGNGVDSTKKKRPDIVSRSNTAECYGDVSISQVHRVSIHEQNMAVVTAYCEAFDPRIRKTSDMLAPFDKTIAETLNKAAKKKLDEYPRIACRAKEGVPERHFFPIIATPDGVLHQSAIDYVDTVCKINAPLCRPNIRERLLACITSSIHCTMLQRNLVFPTYKRSLERAAG
jgi:hypothetical protein